MNLRKISVLHTVTSGTLIIDEEKALAARRQCNEESLQNEIDCAR